MHVNPNVLDEGSLSITAISSRADGLSYAIGTSTGHILLYDIRVAKPFALKDMDYQLRGLHGSRGGRWLVMA